MNSYSRHIVIILVMIAAFVISPKQTIALQDQVNFQVFYDELSPYGEWVDYENYGYVWIPDVGDDFVPYSTAGYWQFTDYGWTWVSDYEWGWAPFHYGRWDYDNYYGWLWVPGNEWGPSWVNWRSADGYYGWSPMEPGISLSLSFERPYDRNHDHWMFVRDRDFERHDLSLYSVNHSENARIIGNSSIIKTTNIDSRHTTYVAGPAREDVQRVVGRTINPITIRENSRPGKDQNNGDLRIYRPKIDKSVGSQNRPAPGRISDLKDFQKPSESRGIVQPRSPNSQNNSPLNTLPGQQQRTTTPGTPNVRQQPSVERPQYNRVNPQPDQQQRTTTPGNTNVRQQPAVERPQNNRVNSQPAQHQTVTPVNNGNRQQPAATKSQISNINRNNRGQQPSNGRPPNTNLNEHQKESKPERDK